MTSPKPKRTPGPWRWYFEQAGVHIDGGNGAVHIAEVDTENCDGRLCAEQDAAFIVEACNVHDTLTEQRDKLAKVLLAMRDELQVWNSGGDPRSATWPESRIRRINTALALLDEGKD